MEMRRDLPVAGDREDVLKYCGEKISFQLHEDMEELNLSRLSGRYLLLSLFLFFIP